MELKTEKVKDEPCLLAIRVEVAKSEVERATEEAYRHIQAEAALPGFRKGKAPMEQIREKFQGRAREDIVEHLAIDAANEVMHGTVKKYVGTPRIHDLKFEFGHPMKFEIHIERLPELQVKDYKKIKLVKKTRRVTDANVDGVLSGLREKMSGLVDAGRDASGPNDFLICDYSLQAPGKPVKEFKNQLLMLEDMQLPEPFRKGLVGIKKGETRKVKFDVDGTAGDCTLTLKEIKEKKLPTVDDELAKDLGFESLLSLRGKIRLALENDNTQTQSREIREQIVDTLLKENKVPVPESMVNEQLEFLLEQAKRTLARDRKMPDSEWERSRPALSEKYRPQAQRIVQTSFIIQTLANQENLFPSDADVDAKIEELSKGSDADKVRSHWKEHRDGLRLHMTEEKVFDFIIANGKIKEEEAKDEPTKGGK